MSVKRIGIMTFHSANNYGAVLQAYALSNYLKRKGMCVEIIDYRPYAIEKVYKPSFCFYKTNLIKGILLFCLRSFSIIKRNIKFEQFRKNNLSLSSVKYDESTISSMENNFDVVIVGSDQVWNLPLTNFDKHYFLDFLDPKTRKASYAASIGKAVLTPDEADFFYKACCTFDYISVREKSGYLLLSQLGLQQKISINVDPVFLLSSNDWNNIIPKMNACHKDYILYFLIGSNDSTIRPFAKKLSHETGLPILFLSNEDKFYKNIEFRHLNSISPDEYLMWIKNATYVVTNSFHATAFSIIFHTPFYSDVQNGLNTRIQNLLEATGLQAQSIQEKIDIKINSIDWTEVDSKIELLKRDSEKYLNTLIKGE